MAVTRISDIIEHDMFDDYVRNLSVETSRLVASGIMLMDPRVQEKAMGEGRTFDMPMWNDLADTEANISNDNPASTSTPDKIGTSQEVAIKHFRNHSWSAADLLASLGGGEDPMDVIAQMVADYWARQDQRMLIATLNGVIADNIANDSGDMVNDIGTDAVGDPAAAELISANAVVDAEATMGDHIGEIVAMGVHSVVYHRLVKNNLIDFVRESDARPRVPFYMGKEVIVDDLCPAVAGTNRIKYDTYLFGRGVVVKGEGRAKVPVEVEREASQGNGAGVETLHHRRELIMHPRGISFVGSPASTSPTNTELEAAASWNRILDRKKVRFAVLRTNG